MVGGAYLGYSAEICAPMMPPRAYIDGCRRISRLLHGEMHPGGRIKKRNQEADGDTTPVNIVKFLLKLPPLCRREAVRRAL